MNLLAVLLGVLILGLALAVAARQAERRRKLAAAVSSRLETLQPALPHEQRIPGLHPRFPMPPTLRRMLARADVGVRFDLLAASGFAVVLTSLAVGVFIGPMTGVGVLALAIIVALMLLSAVGARRVSALVDALPHFLDGVRQLLAASYSFQQAFLKAADEAPPAVRRYLEPAQRRIRNGDSTAEALTAVAERIDCPELHMLATAVRTSARFGGSISPMLQGLAGMIRNRVRVGRELRAATSEVRMSGLVLSIMPPACAAFMILVNHEYMSMLWETSLGRRLLGVSIGLELLGVFLMRRLMRLEF